MHYLDEGRDNQQVVLLLHGNPTWCYYYRNLIEHLKSHFRVIAPDHIGCGLSDHPKTVSFRATHRIEHLQTLVDALELKSFSLVMHDWGGPIGTGLAVRNPHRIERLIYLNTTITETESLPPIIKWAANRFTGPFLTKHTKRFLKLMTNFGVTRKLQKDVKSGYFYPYQKKGRRQAIWDFVADIPFDQNHPSYFEMMYIADRLHLLSEIPVKIIWGLRDLCFHREMLNKVARHFPQAEIVELPNAAHLVLEDEPRLTNDLIEEFLRRKSKKERAIISLPTRTNTQSILFGNLLKQVQKNPLTNAILSYSKFTDSYKQISFAGLLELINKYQRGLEALGMQRGDKVALLVKPGIDFLGLTYAILGRGAIPVFIDPGIGRELLLKTLADLRPQGFIGTPLAQALRFFRKEIFKSLKFNVVASDIFPFWGKNLSFLKRFSSAPPEDTPTSTGTALIAFTSGATGAPKGVVFTEKMIGSQLKIFEKHFKMKAGERDLPLLPVFSIFSLACGVTSVFPSINPSKPIDLDPTALVKVIESSGITSSFGSPTLWNKIAEYCVRVGVSLNGIKRIFMAGVAVDENILRRVATIAPNADIFTPYGATEVLPLTNPSFEELKKSYANLRSAKSGEKGVPVGKPLPGISTRVIKYSNQPIEKLEEGLMREPYEIGEIIVKGDNVSSEYLDNTDANHRLKIREQDGFWHRIGDVGYLNESGEIFFCGRKNDIVSIEGKDLFSVPIESIFNKHPIVRRSALIPLHSKNSAAIVIEPFPGHMPTTTQESENLKKSLLEYAANDPISAPIKEIFFHPNFPVDGRHNAKIFRNKLALWAENQLMKKQ
ncbi:MAG TPA: fatty acid CoA ligase family protein [Oligoflexia bacterium]|nr:fatty acid CoA ligase family protein [Oligoflexia bacterium]